MINKSGQRSRADKEFDDFGSEPKTERVYSDNELYDFDKKIQRFYEEKTLQNPPNTGRKVEILNMEKLHTAYGACREVEQGKDKEGNPIKYYLYNDRYPAFINLWRQYEAWRGKKDWVEGKRSEELKANEEAVPF